MKKVYAVFLIMALAAPALAVSFSASDLGLGKLRISYSVPTGEVLRGVALKLSTTAGTATIASTGSVTAVNSSFNVFLDYAHSVPAGFTITPRVGHPLADPAAAGLLTSFPASTYSLCMGALDEDGDGTMNEGVTGSGVLCEIQYAITGASATIQVEADTLRGGAVVGDAVTQPATLNVVLVNAGFTLTTSVGTPSGTITTPGVGVYSNLTGSQVLLATPAANYRFVNWTGTAATAGKIANVNAASTTVTMDADYTAVANFASIPAPTYVAAGAVSSGTGTITPALPSGIASGDILLLFLETSNQAVSISNQNGGTWTAVTNSPQYCGTAASSTGARLTAFWSRYNGTQGAPTASDSGDHQLGRIIAIRGAVSSGNPWDVTAGGVEAVSDTSGSIPGATTTLANTLVVTAIATSLPDASSTAKFSAWTNANLTSLTERTDNSVTAGNGGGLGIATGIKATAGAYGNTAVTLVDAAYKGMMSIAIRSY
jgi:hypothetical protein